MPRSTKNWIRSTSSLSSPLRRLAIASLTRIREPRSRTRRTYRHATHTCSADLQISVAFAAPIIDVIGDFIASLLQQGHGIGQSRVSSHTLDGLDRFHDL